MICLISTNLSLQWVQNFAVHMVVTQVWVSMSEQVWVSMSEHLCNMISNDSRYVCNVICL